jgi:hypothetical protein
MIFAMSPTLTYRVGQSPQRLVSRRQTDGMHHVVVAEGEGSPIGESIGLDAGEDQL